jgi:Cu+-exporting ATPase
LDARDDQRGGGARHRVPVCVGACHADGHHGRHRQGRENGILFKNSESLERAGRVRAIVLDKTGTITRGEPSLTDVVPGEGWGKADDLLRLAASAERGSEHPLGQAIVAAAMEKGCRWSSRNAFRR